MYNVDIMPYFNSAYLVNLNAKRIGAFSMLQLDAVGFWRQGKFRYMNYCNYLEDEEIWRLEIRKTLSIRR